MKKLLCGFALGTLVTSSLFYWIWSHRSSEIQQDNVQSATSDHVEKPNEPTALQDDCLYTNTETNQVDQQASDTDLKPETAEEKLIEKELLPPPAYDKRMPESFETKDPGEFYIAWKEVTHGKRYRIYIYSKNHELITTRSTTGLHLYVQNIPFKGEDAPYVDYYVKIATMNMDGKFGEQGKARPLRLWKKHGYIKVSPNRAARLVAPEVLSIKVED